MAGAALERSGGARRARVGVGCAHESARYLNPYEVVWRITFVMPRMDCSCAWVGAARFAPPAGSAGSLPWRTTAEGPDCGLVCGCGCGCGCAYPAGAILLELGCLPTQHPHLQKRGVGAARRAAGLSRTCPPKVPTASPSPLSSSQAQRQPFPPGPPAP